MHANDWPKGIKKTGQRIAIRRILAEAGRPVSAFEIEVQLKKLLLASEAKRVWKSTVYRTLDLFVAHGLVTRHTVNSGDTALYEPTPKTHRHYAVCTVCRCMIALPACPVHDLDDVPLPAGFTPTGHHIEISGICESCNKKP